MAPQANVLSKLHYKGKWEPRLKSSVTEGENRLAGRVRRVLEALEPLADAGARSLLSTVHLFGVRDEALEVGNHGFELAGNGGHEDTCASLRP